MAVASRTNPESVRAVERAIDVLEAFTLEQPALTITELGRRTGLSRPTLYRLLHSLIRRGLVRQDGEPPRYRLDAGAARFAAIWSNSFDLGRQALPELARLRDRFDETVSLFLRVGDRRLCVAELASRQPLSFARGVGYSESLRVGASGMAILAFAAPADVERILAEERDPARAAQIRRRLGQVRQRGYALSGGDLIVGAQAIAAPIRDRHGAAVAAIGLFGPAARFPSERVEECGAAVRDAGQALSRALGFAGLAAA
jgi:IclR family acetate operon transcriptional repressor